MASDTDYHACAAAQKALGEAQTKMKRLFNRKAKVRSFNPGDYILALLPMPNNPFHAKFVGPYKVEKYVSDMNYLISTPDRRKKVQLCHINLLKPYHSVELFEPAQSSKPALPVQSVLLSPIAEGRDLASRDMSPTSDEGEDILAEGVFGGKLKNSEYLRSLEDYFRYMPNEQRADLIHLVQKYLCLFPDVPSRTNVLTHDIDVGSAIPIKQRFYRVPLPKQRYLDTEIDYMIKNGIAKPSFSEWSSPCILVGKPDGTYRFCSDFRKVNTH